MNLGKIINYHRKKQHMTQEQLCHGICSASHLSKIENDTKEANIETLKLLCNRLGISIDDEEEKIKRIKEQLQRFYNGMERLHNKQVESLFNELSKYKEYVKFTDLLYLYDLYLLRYYLYVHQYQKVEEQVEKIKINKKKFTQYEAFVWNVVNAIYYHRKNDFSKALELLNEVKDLRKRYRDQITEYYYLKAIMHSKLSQSALAIYYGNKAFEIYKQSNNTIRLLDTKTILSIHLIRTGEYASAEKLLMEILNEAESIQNNTIIETALHNLGFLYGSQNCSEKALDYYYQSLAMIEKNTDGYYLTLGNIVEHLLKLHKNQQVIETLAQELESFEDKTKLEYIKLQIFYLEAQNNEEEVIQFLISHGLPIMEKTNNRMKVYEFSERIAKYFQRQGNAILANEYLQISFHNYKIIHSNKGVIK
ncbi:helix-turn-helix transcriptional regulator [Bacillus sp. AFS017336]|uniref:helix-turn-helix transcriptional regulator n=1 Tax=Bacillus sp. AFS017336 TaxID=2033489 RepID=UPI0015CF41B1|nr:helix-turn-helix transcriptional regulator [Bacillus sp. AFS017336]